MWGVGGEDERGDLFFLSLWLVSNRQEAAMFEREAIFFACSLLCFIFSRAGGYWSLFSPAVMSGII